MKTEKTAAHPLMIQGTCSSAGKSLITAALCRILTQDGYSVAPFKSQNMALNSGVTPDGFEIGRAQIMQAECAKKEADTRMNPVLLKPTSQSGSQVIVNGEILAQMDASEYFSFRKKLIPVIKKNYKSLAAENDAVIIEGAGSPAEINLKKNDIANMGMAKIADSPVLLVADIDRGGVFASLYGTVKLLTRSERARVKGLVINKFRGKRELLEPGLREIERLTKIPVLGVLPFIQDLAVDEEDSLSSRLETKSAGKNQLFHVAVCRLPYIANFTDLAPLQNLDFATISFFDSCETFAQNEAIFGAADLIIIPGTKNTIASAQYLRKSGLSKLIQNEASCGTLVIGICGGYQLLGQKLSDLEGFEGGKQGIVETGLALLPTQTSFGKNKIRRRFSGRIPEISGDFSFLSGLSADGYEIHSGLTSGSITDFPAAWNKNVFGTYLHGFFDSKEILHSILNHIAEKKGIDLPDFEDFRSRKEKEYERLAAIVRSSLDMEKIYGIMGLSGRGNKI